MKRFWEIDVVRGIAIVLMVIFNYSFALSFLNVFTIDGGYLFWYVFPRAIASMFILISGVSLTLSFNQNKSEAQRKITMRGLKIFGFGALITLVTLVTFPQNFIVFGILSLIGFSMIAGQFFLRFKGFNLIVGIILVLTGTVLGGFRFDFPWLLWLGFVPNNFSTLDYFPVLPWFGVSLIGIYLGNRFYRNGKRSFEIRNYYNHLVRFLSFVGRNSLAIYLLHQPVLVAILMLTGFRVL